MFQRVKAWKQAGLSAIGVMVLAYVADFGMAPVGVIASACEVSDRSVYEALGKARKAGLLLGLQESAQHDHDHKHHGEKKESCGNLQTGPQDPAVVGPEAAAVSALVEQGIYAGTARKLLQDHGLEQVERQLAHHKARADLGFGYQRAPGAYLYRAIKQDLPGPWSPPPGLAQAQERKAAEIQARPAPQPLREEPKDTMDRPTAIKMLPLLAKSSIPAVRAEARRYAELYSLSLPAGSAAALESSSPHSACARLTATA